MLNFQSKNHILVIGDVILDHTFHGEVHRTAPEAPTPVVTYSREVYQAGGAANLALNLLALGMNVYLVGVVGQDEDGQKLEDILSFVKDPNFQFFLINDPGYMTPKKIRVKVDGKQLLRLDYEIPTTTPGKNLLGWLELTDGLDGYDALVLSDYGKGVFSTWGVPREICYMARNAGIPCFVDPKGGCSWRNDSTSFRFPGATLIKPNIKELNMLEAEPEESDVELVAGDFCSRNGVDYLVITAGNRGLYHYDHEKKDFGYCPARIVQEVDPTGAGDSVLATLVAARLSGKSFANAAYYASFAGATAVTLEGTEPVGLYRLNKALAAEHILSKSTQTFVEVCALVEAYRKEEKGSVVFTNGCFDLLHPGHWTTLHYAKTRGDLLVVAMNSDQSVRDLKGPGRPSMTWTDRAIMLSALPEVDLIVHFETEDQLKQLVKQIRPEVVVKGAEWKDRQLTYQEEVEEVKARVDYAPYDGTMSTTRLIEKIKRGD